MTRGREENDELKRAKRSIRNNVSRYRFGCFLFLLAAIGFIGVGVLMFWGNGLSSRCAVFPLVGFVLIGDMAKALNQKCDLPDDFREVSETEYPQLFALIDEVRRSMGAERLRHVYVCPDAFAAIFALPSLKNMFLPSRKNLVIGLAFLTQMSDDELRAILCHEYAHYMKGDLSSSESVYRVGQFSKGFLSVSSKPASTTWGSLAKSLTGLFSWYSYFLCKKIREAYRNLDEPMEQAADDVAMKYVTVSTLQGALVHAACLDVEYKFLRWGLRRLEAEGITLADPYEALGICFEIMRPRVHSIKPSVMQRVQRLGELEASGNNGGYGVRDALPSLLLSKGKEGCEVCDAADFAEWLNDGWQEYEYQQALRRSVRLEVHLDRKKHKIPLVDGFYQVVLDGMPIGRGNYLKGFSLHKRIGPGAHTLTFHATTGVKPFPYRFEADAGKSYFMEIDYRAHLSTGIYDLFVDRFESV